MRHQPLSARLFGTVGLLTVLFAPAAQSAPPTTAPITKEGLSIQLGYSSEGNYTQVAITGSTLSYTYNQRNSLEKPGDIGSMMRQAPHWTKADLTTENVSLSAKEVDDLKRLLVRTRFFSLKPVYGNGRGRYYPITIIAGLHGKTRRVEYRSGQGGGGPEPTAFHAVKGRLIQLINAKCRHKIAL